VSGKKNQNTKYAKRFICFMCLHPRAKESRLAFLQVEAGLNAVQAYSAEEHLYTMAAKYVSCMLDAGEAVAREGDCYRLSGGSGNANVWQARKGKR